MTDFFFVFMNFGRFQAFLGLIFSYFLELLLFKNCFLIKGYITTAKKIIVKNCLTIILLILWQKNELPVLECDLSFSCH